MLDENGENRGENTLDKDKYQKIPETFTTEYKKSLKTPVTCNACYLSDSGKCRLQYKYDGPSCRQHRKRKQSYRDEVQDKVFYELVILQKGYPPKEMNLLEFFPQKQNLEEISMEKTKNDGDQHKEVNVSQMGTAQSIKKSILKVSKALFRKSHDAENPHN